jgi:hypothetical protein
VLQSGVGLLHETVEGVEGRKDNFPMLICTKTMKTEKMKMRRT